MSNSRISWGFSKMMPGAMSGQSRAVNPPTRFGSRLKIMSPPTPEVFFSADLSGWFTGESDPLTFEWTLNDTSCGVEIDDIGGGVFSTATLPEGCYQITATIVYAGAEGDITVEVSQGASIWGSNTDTGTSTLNVDVPEVGGQLVVFDDEGLHIPESGTLSILCGEDYCPTGTENVDAGLAQATGTAHNASTSSSASVNAGVATATGTAYNATIATGIGALAGVATGTGTGHNASASVKPTALVATASGTAYTASVSGAGEAPAGVAMATGTAYNATISTSTGDTMITEDGDTMITEDGDTMIPED